MHRRVQTEGIDRKCMFVGFVILEFYADYAFALLGPSPGEFFHYRSRTLRARVKRSIFDLSPPIQGLLTRRYVTHSIPQGP